MNERNEHDTSSKPRTYARRLEVEAQVRRLLAMRPKEREREVLMLCSQIYPGKTYPPGTLEVLVWAIRHGCRRISKAYDEALARIYAASYTFIKGKVKKFGYSNVEAERIIEETVTSMMEQLLDGDSRISFWECQFLRCLNYRFETVSAKSNVRRPISGAASLDDGSPYEISDETLSVEEMVILRSVMAQLTDEERLVLYLKCVELLPEESLDPSVDTIARRIRKTGRTVRNILNRIRERHHESESM